jgi:FlaA1/EpsC-like NDP-sugar epimerase
MSNLWKDFFTKAPNTKFTKIPIVRILALIFLDIMTSLTCSFMAIYIRYDFRITDIEKRFWDAYVAGILPIILITLGCFAIFGLYNSVWRYASANELVKIVVSTLIAALLFLAESRLTHHYLPRSYYPFYWVFMMIATCLVRFGYRILRLINAKRKDLFSHSEISNVMVVGAGAAGDMILKEIESSRYLAMQARCIIDDNPGCHGKKMRGIPIVGDRNDIPKAVEKYQIDEIIFAIPSANDQTRTEILEIAKETGCKIRTLPGM